MRQISFVFALLSLLLVACDGDDDSKSVGALGDACYPNNTCDDGLECDNGTCVSLVSNDDGGDVDVSVDIDGQPDNTQQDIDLVTDSSDEQSDSDSLVEPYCGDGVVSGIEVCDGDSIDCVTLDAKYVGGTAECNNGCSAYDESTCQLPVGSHTDPVTGLVWMLGTANDPDHGGIVYDATICDDLVIDGRDDWRVPTIDELRTLIVGCFWTETGNACNVCEECSGKECLNSECAGCEDIKGPGLSGRYMEPGVWWDTFGATYWSSTQVKTDSEYQWVIDFNKGKIEWLMNMIGNSPGTAHTKCVAGSMN